MDGELVLVERRDAVAVITLNRPEKHNAMNTAMAAAFIGAIDALEADDTVRCLVVTGAGERAFCAGADMMEAMQAGETDGRRVSLADVYRRLARCPKPLVAAVNGYAYGGGAMLAVICDLRIASHTARFRFPGAEYGIVVGGAWLPRLLASPHVKELVLTADPIDARQALRIGLVNRIEVLPEVVEAAVTVAERIAANDPEAVRYSKAVIDTATYSQAAYDQENEANRVLRASEEHRRRFREASERVTS